MKRPVAGSTEPATGRFVAVFGGEPTGPAATHPRVAF
jgi:hypothetical protein